MLYILATVGVLVAMVVRKRNSPSMKNAQAALESKALR